MLLSNFRLITIDVALKCQVSKEPPMLLSKFRFRTIDAALKYFRLGTSNAALKVQVQNN